jgi:hypothetical protein
MTSETKKKSETRKKMWEQYICAKQKKQYMDINAGTCRPKQKNVPNDICN